MTQLSFSLPEILAIIGVIQCTYLVVHVAFRSGQIARAGLPLLYFLVLGAAFTVDLLQGRWAIEGNLYFYLEWLLWFAGPPLSVVLIIQLADMNQRPALRDFWVVLLLPLSFMLSWLAASTIIECDSLNNCPEMYELLSVTGLMAGTISLLLIFSKKDLLKNISKQRHGRERYWLIFALIVLNTFFLLLTLLVLTEHLDGGDYKNLRAVLGIGFVYLVSTSLLRIFPQGSKSSAQSVNIEELSEAELVLAQKVEHLLEVEKVYHEPSYSRADLARECNTSETVISRIINVYFKKSFPQLMNEPRIEDAKQLLIETDANIQTIAQEVGFNSLPSFNRVFKDMTGQAPSVFRKQASQNVNSSL